MKILLGGISALELWDKGLENRVYPTGISSLAGFELTREKLHAYEPKDLGVSEPGCLLVPGNANRLNTQSWVSRTWSGKLPPESIYQATECLFFASPELCFQMLSRQLGLIDTIKLGMELCGKYSTLVPPGRSYRTRPSLTNVSRLSRFIAETGGRAGRSIAARALSYVSDGAESPMETATRIMLCLPHRYGCPGFSLPTMNPEIPLDTKERILLGKDTLRPDLLWEDKMVAVEYKGGESHSGATAMRSDSAREAILVSRGYTVIPAVYPSLATREGFETLTVALASSLEKRIRNLDGDYYRNQDATRAIVLRGNTCSWVSAD